MANIIEEMNFQFYFILINFYLSSPMLDNTLPEEIHNVEHYSLWSSVKNTYTLAYSPLQYLTGLHSNRCHSFRSTKPLILIGHK